MKQINIIGNIFGQTGYASHTRSLLNALINQHPNVKLSQEQLPSAWQTQVTEVEKIAIEKTLEDAENRLDIYINLPHLNTPYLINSKNFAQFVIWEGTSIPTFWLKHLSDKRIKYIFVASNHTKEAIYNTTDDKTIRGKIEIIPHGVDVKAFIPGKKRDEDFIFLAHKGWADALNDRGGMQYIIKAYVEEFNKDEKVKLLLKINKVYNPDFNIVAAIESLNLSKPKDERPCVMITDQPISQQQLIKEIYQQGDVFVSATMGEAFNLPVAEALSCGLPAIVTNFGGQIDFVDNDNGWLIDYKLVKPNNIMYEETQWAMPSITDLRKKMREAFNSKDLDLKRKIARDSVMFLTWENTAKKIINLK